MIMKLNGMHSVFTPVSTFLTRNSLVVLVAIVAVFSATVISSASSGDKSSKKTLSVEVDVNNFGKVTDFFYRGAQPKEDEYEQLAALGVKTVIDLRNDPKGYAEATARQFGLKYINLPMSDKNYPAADADDKFLSLVNDKANHPVFVHCAGGRHRTGAMIAVYRMKMQGWDVEQAYDEMKDYDFYTRWGHKAMKKYVFDYYRELLISRRIEQVGYSTGSNSQSSINK